MYYVQYMHCCYCRQAVSPARMTPPRPQRFVITAMCIIECSSTTHQSCNNPTLTREHSTCRLRIFGLQGPSKKTPFRSGMTKPQPPVGGHVQHDLFTDPRLLRRAAICTWRAVSKMQGRPQLCATSTCSRIAMRQISASADASTAMAPAACSHWTEWAPATLSAVRAEDCVVHRQGV